VWPSRTLAARVPGNIDMNTAPDLTMPTAIAATDQTHPTAAPRLKLLSHGFAIDHPDPELGEQLMANALGVVADREAIDGILRQLVRASVSGGSPLLHDCDGEEHQAAVGAAAQIATQAT
jgi:hypothetical protein